MGPAAKMQLGGISIPGNGPVLIAGPTASGKSALALAVAQATGGTIVNADALQVFDGWRVLTARPSDEDLHGAPHALYGHVPFDATYSVGDWLKDVQSLMSQGPAPLIFTGGTGLYFRALTEGLSDIPPVPDAILARANAAPLADLIAGLDAPSAARIALQPPRRVQRAWAVLRATGRGLADWHDATPPPLVPLATATALLVEAPVDWLSPRIERRFDLMIKGGALDEAREMLPHWNPTAQSAQAIGAPELIAHLRGDLTLDQAHEAAVIATRQYAKRQRTWFRARMKGWNVLAGQTL